MKIMMGWLAVAFAISVLMVCCGTSSEEEDCRHQRRVVEENPTTFRVKFAACVDDESIGGVIDHAVMVNGAGEQVDVRKLGGGINETANYFWATFTKENMTQHSEWAYHVDCEPQPGDCWITNITLDIYETDFTLVIEDKSYDEDLGQDKITLRCESTLNDSSDVRVEFLYAPSSPPPASTTEEEWGGGEGGGEERGGEGAARNASLLCREDQTGIVTYNNDTWSVSRSTPNADCVLTMLVDQADQGTYACRASLSYQPEYSEERTILVEYALATPPTRSPPSPPHGGTPVALIAGVSVGVAVLLLVVLFAILTKVARPRLQQAPRPPEERQPLLVGENGEHREIRQYDALEGRNPSVGGQVMPPVDHVMPPGDHVMPPGDHVMPPGGQVMLPGGQVTPGPEEGDGRGRRSVFMYQAEGEGPDYDTEVPAVVSPTTVPRNTSPVLVVGGGGGGGGPPGSLAGGESVILGATPGAQVTLPTPALDDPPTLPPSHADPEPSPSHQAGRGPPSMESTGTQGGDNGRGAGVGGGSEGGDGTGAGVGGGGSDEGEGASGESSPPSVPGNSPSPVDNPTGTRSRGASSVASTQGSQSKQGSATSSPYVSPHVTQEHPKAPSPPPSDAPGSSAPPSSSGPPPSSGPPSSLRSDRTQGAYSEEGGSQASTGKSSPGLPLSQDSDADGSRTSTPTISSGPSSTTELLLGDQEWSSDDSRPSASRRRTASPLTTKEYRSTAAS